MAHRYEACRLQMCRVTHVKESCHTWGYSRGRHGTYEWFMSQIWMSDVTHWRSHVISGDRRQTSQTSWPIWMSHVPHTHEPRHTLKESCHTWGDRCRTCHGHVTYEWPWSCRRVMSHMNESCPICEWVTSHIWRSHGTHQVTDVADAMVLQTLFRYISHGTRHVTRHTLDSFTHVWMSHGPSIASHVPLTCVKCLNHMCDMTHSLVWHVSSIYMTWRTTQLRSHVCYASFTWESWLMYVCDMTDWHERHERFT